jgi:S-methylmethionine-dependent homocysteine/selenocysteine methylase
LTDEAFAAKGEEYFEDLYRQIGAALAPNVDAFLCETMNTEQEMACAVRAVQGLGKPIWVSFEPTFRGERLAPRPELAESAAKKVLQCAEAGADITYLGFNCSTPDYITQALESLSAETRTALAAKKIVLGVAPNFNDIEIKHRAGFDVAQIKKADGSAAAAGAGVHKVVKRDDMVGGKWVSWADKWTAMGVTCIGACCGSVPNDIKFLAEHTTCPPARG